MFTPRPLIIVSCYFLFLNTDLDYNGYFFGANSNKRS